MCKPSWLTPDVSFLKIHKLLRNLKVMDIVHKFLNRDVEQVCHGLFATLALVEKAVRTEGAEGQSMNMTFRFVDFCCSIATAGAAQEICKRSRVDLGGAIAGLHAGAGAGSISARRSCTRTKS